MTSSRRLEKINEEIKNILGKIIFSEYSDPMYLISITRVDTSADLHHAKIFVSALKDLPSAVNNLNLHKGAISRQLAAKMTTKFTPKILFLPDDSIAYADQISKVIDQAIKKK